MPFVDPLTAPQTVAGLRTIDQAQLAAIGAGERVAQPDPMRAAPIAAIAAATQPAGVRRSFDLVPRPSPAAINAQFLFAS